MIILRIFRIIYFIVVNLMEERFSRTKALIGSDALEKLKNSTVAIFGIGGVGGAVLEALARGGVGHLFIVDADDISLSNINRQILALSSNVGTSKVEAAKERIKDICPETRVTVKKCFFLPESSHEFDFSLFDYVVDAVDTVSAKLEIIKRAKEANVPVISSMGTGNKLDPTAFKVADIKKTKVCPLARVMRTELKKRGIDGVKCVYSEEEPQKNLSNKNESSKKITPSSVSFVPPVAGYIMAGEVIKDLISF